MSDLSLKRPTSRRSAEKISQGEKRIVADVPEELHRQMRKRCLDDGISVRNYLIKLLAKDGIKLTNVQPYNGTKGEK